MHFQKQSSVRLELESLEDRSLPNNFTIGGCTFDPDSLVPGHAKSDSDQLYSAATTVAYLQNLVRADVIPPVGPLGTVYSDLSVAWWRYAYSVPAGQSPWLDGTGANFAVNQSGPVWYLAGSFDTYNPVTGAETGAASYADPAVVTRNVTMPEGKFLYFPILNVEWDNYNPGGPDATMTVPQLKADANEYLATIDTKSMTLTVDGAKVKDLTAYLTNTPVFSYNLPNNDIYGETGAPKESTVHPAIGGGYYILLEPLSPGQHTIHFTGSAVPSTISPSGYGEDITYHITVTK